MLYQFSREREAQAIADTLNQLYPSYKHVAEKRDRLRYWRIAVYCKATNAFLRWAQMTD